MINVGKDATHRVQHISCTTKFCHTVELLGCKITSMVFYMLDKIKYTYIHMSKFQTMDQPVTRSEITYYQCFRNKSFEDQTHAYFTIFMDYRESTHLSYLILLQLKEGLFPPLLSRGEGGEEKCRQYDALESLFIRFCCLFLFSLFLCFMKQRAQITNNSKKHLEMRADLYKRLVDIRFSGGASTVPLSLSVLSLYKYI